MDTSIAENASRRKRRLKGLLDLGGQINADIETTNQLETMQKIAEMIRESDNIIDEGEVKERAQHTTEIVMDAQVLKLGHDLMNKVMKSCSTEFSEQEYINVINGVIMGEDNTVNWDAITKIACKIAKPFRFSSCLLGSFEHVPEVVEKTQKERQRHARRTQTQEQRPENIEKLEKQGKGIIKINLIMKQITKLFAENDYKPIPFYKFIIDPENFMNTVDNALQVAFLAKDGSIAITKGPDNYPAIQPCSKQQKEKKDDLTHACCKLSMQLCQEMIEFYGITESMIILDRDELDGTQRR